MKRDEAMLFSPRRAERAWGVFFSDILRLSLSTQCLMPLVMTSKHLKGRLDPPVSNEKCLFVCDKK